MKFLKSKKGVMVNVEAIASAKIKTRPKDVKTKRNPAAGFPNEPDTLEVPIGEIRSVEVSLKNGEEHVFEGAEAEELIVILAK